MNISNNQLIKSIINEYRETKKINKKLFKELMERNLYEKFIIKFPKHILISSKGNVFMMVPGHNIKTEIKDRLKQADLMEKLFNK